MATLIIRVRVCKCITDTNMFIYHIVVNVTIIQCLIPKTYCKRNASGKHRRCRGMHCSGAPQRSLQYCREHLLMLIIYLTFIISNSPDISYSSVSEALLILDKNKSVKRHAIREIMEKCNMHFSIKTLKKGWNKA